MGFQKTSRMNFKTDVGRFVSVDWWLEVGTSVSKHSNCDTNILEQVNIVPNTPSLLLGPA